MKTVIIATIAIVVLMIGTPLVYAHRLTDTEKEAGIASDAQGRVCNFGPHHDECHDSFLERTNNAAYQSGFKHGVVDGKPVYTQCIPETFPCPPDTLYIHQPGKGFAFHTTAFVNGYIKGWCLAHHGGGIEANDDPEPTLAILNNISSLIHNPG